MNRELLKAEKRINYDIPSGEAPAERHIVKGREGPCMPAIETEAITIAFKIRVRSRLNRSAPPLRRTNKEREEDAT